MRKNTLPVIVLATLATAACTPAGGRRGNPNPSSSDALAKDTSLAFPDTIFQVSDTVDPADSVVDPGDAPPPPTDDGPPPKDEGPPQKDDGPPPKDDGPDPPPMPVSGGVLIVEVVSTDPAYQLAYVNAKMRFGPEPVPDANYVEGNCSVIYSNGTTPPDNTIGIDGGTITVTGLTQSMVMPPVNGGPQGTTYSSGLPESQPTIIGGVGTIGVATAGGKDVPAWSTGVPAPAQIFVTSPSAGGKVNKSNALNVLWNKGNGNFTRIDMFVYDGVDEEQKSGNTITCNIPGDPGSFVIPKSVMKKLPGGGDDGFPDFNFDYVIFGVSRITLKEVVLPDGWGTVQVAATRTAGGAAKLDK